MLTVTARDWVSSILEAVRRGAPQVPGTRADGSRAPHAAAGTHEDAWLVNVSTLAKYLWENHGRVDLAFLAELLPGVQRGGVSGRPVRLCDYIINEAARFIRKVEARGLDAGRARDCLEAARQSADEGEEIPALALARLAILLAKLALPKNKHAELHAEARSLLVAVDMTMDAYDELEMRASPAH